MRGKDVCSNVKEDDILTGVIFIHVRDKLFSEYCPFFDQSDVGIRPKSKPKPGASFSIRQVKVIPA